MDIASITSPASSATGAEADRQKLSDDFDNFLLLLTTQLQNQDPTSPMDANEFTQQIVSFSQVEQSIETNSHLEKLVNQSTSGQLSGAMDYIGHRVQAESSVFPVQTSGEPVTLEYTMPASSEDTLLAIADSAGRVLFQTKVTGTAGHHAYEWDGRDAAGNPVAPGAYQVKIQAEDAGGSPIAATTYIQGRVTGVDSSSGEVIMEMGDAYVPLSAVYAIKE